MIRNISGILFVSLACLLSHPAHCLPTKPQTDLVVDRPPFTFFAFNAPKDSHAHGIILNQHDGRAWIVIDFDDGKFAARPVEFELYRIKNVIDKDGNLIKLPHYSPSEANGFRFYEPETQTGKSAPPKEPEIKK